MVTETRTDRNTQDELDLTRAVYSLTESDWVAALCRADTAEIARCRVELDSLELEIDRLTAQREAIWTLESEARRASAERAYAMGVV